jgi:hypothetical protein
MAASLETLVVAAYVFAASVSIPRPGPEGLIADHELIALAVAQAATGICSDRQFLGVIGQPLPGWFAHCPTRRTTTVASGARRRGSRRCRYRSPS